MSYALIERINKPKDIELSTRLRSCNLKLLKILQMERIKSNDILIPEDKEVILRLYATHHRNSSIFVFFEHLKNCADDKTKELVIDEIMAWEETNGHSGNKIEVLNCLMLRIKDTQLRQWIYDLSDRGIVYSIKKGFMKLLAKLCWHEFKFCDKLNLFWSFTFAFIEISLFYFDLYKDLMGFYLFHHISTQILVIIFQ